MIHEYRDFYAIQDAMPGADGTLRVGGVCVFTTSGYSARLEPYEGNPGINPLILHLTLAVSEPPAGAAVLDVLTSVTLEEYRVERPAQEYQQVSFHLRGAEGSPPPPTVEVQRPV